MAGLDTSEHQWMIAEESVQKRAQWEMLDREIEVLDAMLEEE